MQSCILAVIILVAMVQKTLPLITSSISVHMCFSYKEKTVPEWIRKILLDKIAMMLCKYRFFNRFSHKTQVRCKDFVTEVQD